MPVHRAVAKAFLDPVEGKNVVNHKDGDKSNNSVDNLEWSTPSENATHSMRTLNNIIAHYIFSEAQIAAIRNDDRPQAVIAKEYGVDQMAICRIKRGETYRQYGGRLTICSRSAPHRLTDEEVLAVRSSKASVAELAEQYNVARSTVCRIRKGLRRKEVKND